MADYYGILGGSGGTGTISLGPSYGDGSPSISATVGTVSLSATVTDILAEKDVYVPDVVACPDDTNHNGEDIIIDGVVATLKNGWLGWDLSTYPSGATVSSANVKVNMKTGYAVGQPSIDLHSIAQANEGWSETTISCSTDPATVNNLQAGNSLNNTGDTTITLNSSWRTLMANRMGSSNCTIVAKAPNSTFTQFTLEAADEGTNNASGPRLTFSFSKTL